MGRSHGPPISMFARGTATIRYTVLTELSDIERISGDWQALLRRSPCNRAFSSPAWFLGACRVHPELAPHAIITWRGAEIVAILPLAVTADGKEAVFPSPMSNYNDLIAAPDDGEALAGTLEYAISGPRPYERINLRWLTLSSNCLRAVHLLGAQPEQATCFHTERDYFYIRLPPFYNDYLRSRSRVFRKGISRAVKKAAAAGLIVRELDPASFPARRVPDLFLALQQARFGEASAFREQPRNAVFAELVLPPLFAERQMLVFALYQRDEIIGIDLSMLGANSLCTWNGGYPPEAERWSPGRLLLDAGIRKAFALGLEEYDLLRGTQAWKASWANQVRSVGRVEMAVARR
jgi:CelD/BcsL family acetyltransferase involved in cellulose biosynthesis